jgi:hypothetical protein
VRRAIALTSFLGSFLSTLFAHGVASADESCDDRFVPDRPGATDAHTTVGAGCLHLATSVDVTRGPDATGLTFPSIARIGFIRPLELRILHGIVDIALPDEEPSEVDATPLGVAFKWMALEADGHVPGMGAMFGVFAPTNSDFGDEITPVLTWLFDWAFVDPLALSVNLIGSIPPFPVQGQPRSARADYASVLSAAVPVPGDWLSFYIDNTGGALLHDGQWDQKVGGGAVFLVRDNLQLDLTFDVVVTGEDHPVRVGPGIAWRL